MSLSKFRNRIFPLFLPIFLVVCLSTTTQAAQPDLKEGAKKIIVDNKTKYPLWISFDPVDSSNIAKVTVGPNQKGEPNLVARSIYANQGSIYYLGYGEGAKVQQSKEAEKVAYDKINKTSLIAKIDGKEIQFYVKFTYNPENKTTTATITDKDISKEL